MIEPLHFNNLIKTIDRRPSIPSSFSGSSTPFQDILNQENHSTKSLEQVVLDFLIKTIESILSKEGRVDRSSAFPHFPLFMEGSLQSHPDPVKPLPEVEAALPAASPKGQEIDEIIQKSASRFGLEPALIKAVISVESNGNPRAVSPAGAQGLMQLMPGTAADLGVTDPFDPVQNIKAGTRYLSQLMDRYQGNLNLALAAYNWGMGNVEKNPHGLPRETRNYIVRVGKRYQAYLNASSTA